jgi:hypothetical protein
MMTTVLRHYEYDVGNLEFEPANINTKKQFSQNLHFPIYQGDRSPLIQLPKISLEMYGVPSKSEFYKEDSQRMFLKLPLDQKSDDVRAMTDGLLKKIDLKFCTDKVKEKLVGKKNSKHNYQPIVRVPLTEDGTINTEKSPYIKLKLSTNYGSGDITNMKMVNENCFPIRKPLMVLLTRFDF